MTRLVTAIWEDDVQGVLRALKSGYLLEQWVDERPVCRAEPTHYFDGTACTALGWAVSSWCSPMLIWFLVAGGACVDAPCAIIHDPLWCESPREMLLRMQLEFAKDSSGVLRAASMQRWGRAPTEQWFQEVLDIFDGRRKWPQNETMK
jgi:hypothetical protein